jgi:hypothetical protein
MIAAGQMSPWLTWTRYIMAFLLSILQLIIDRGLWRRAQPVIRLATAGATDEVEHPDGLDARRSAARSKANASRPIAIGEGWERAFGGERDSVAREYVRACSTSNVRFFYYCWSPVGLVCNALALLTNPQTSTGRRADVNGLREGSLGFPY